MRWMRFLPLGGPSLSPGGGHAQQAAWEVVGILCLVKPQSYGSGSELNLNNNNNKKKTWIDAPLDGDCLKASMGVPLWLSS